MKLLAETLSFVFFNTLLGITINFTERYSTYYGRIA
jgi:hypothetical protein